MCTGTEDTARIKLTRCDGVYVKGEIENIPVTFTADTGATRSLISKEIYDSLAEDNRPLLKKCCSLSGPGGDTLTSYGKAEFNIKFGMIFLKSELIVAEIEDEALIGIDILQNHKEGPADLLLSEGIIRMRGNRIPCEQVGLPHPLRKVICLRDVTIPGHTEVVCDAVIESSEDDSLSEMIIEATHSFTENNSLAMARCVVQVKEDHIAKVRLMNPYPDDAVFRENTLLGYAEPLESSVHVLQEVEDTIDQGNIQAIRNIRFNSTKPKCGEKIRRSKNKVTSNFLNRVPDHLQDLFEKSTQHGSEKEKKMMAETLEKYEDVFSKNDLDLGLTHLAEHTIDTQGAHPIKQPPCRVPLALAEEERLAILQLQEQNVIEESFSPWACPIVLVKKKNGKIRPCMDYRRLNDVTVKDAFPLPRIQDCLDAVTGSTYFTTFDLTSGYLQIPVKEEDRPKTAFVTKYGLYQFTTMPFGLTNAPATCERLMELVLRGLQWQTCLIYLDDIIVFGSDLEEHIDRVQEVLERIRQAGLKLKPEKCQMLQQQVTFLGHIVSKDGVSPDPQNVMKMVEWPVPTNVKEVRQFLGMASYYRRFVKIFAKIARPLTDLTRKSKEFSWDKNCQDAFEKLKKTLTGPEIMSYPLPDGEFILDTDACDTAIGAVLCQVQDGKEKVIAYGSRSMNRAERNYCITDKELLAVRHFVEYFRQYLLGRKFRVRSDHRALVWLFSLREPKSRIARWIELLSPYNFSVEYRPGTQHGNADAMSRCPNPRDCTCDEIDNMENLPCGPCNKCQKRSIDMQSPVVLQEKSNNSKVKRLTGESIRIERKLNLDIMSLLTMVMYYIQLICGIPKLSNDLVRAVTTRSRNKPSRIKDKCPKKKSTKENDAITPTPTSWCEIYSPLQLQQLQRTDPDISKVHSWMKTGNRPTYSAMCMESPAVRHYWTQWSLLEWCNGIIYRKFFKADGSSYLQLLTPEKLRNKILRLMHDCVISGHLGRKKTQKRLLQRYYWYDARTDVLLWVTQCDICAAAKRPSKTVRAPLGKMTVGAVLDRVSTDILGPLPETPRGNRFIIVITDYFSKWVEIFPLPDQTAISCAEVMLNEFIGRFGFPLDLHSDRGSNYTSDIFAELCELLEIRKTQTSARNPKGNGQVERFNSTLIKMIKCYIKHDQTSWDRNLGCLAAAYRSTPHESTNLTPNLLMLGREVRLPVEVIYGNHTSLADEPVSNYGEYVEHLRQKMFSAHVLARKYLSNAAARQKCRYDLKTSLPFRSYKVGDAVWCLAEARKVKQCTKLQMAYDGPFLVLEKLSEHDYLIQMNEEGKSKIFHYDKLKPYKGVNKPGWGQSETNTTQ